MAWLQERASAHCARLIELSPPPHDHPKMRQTYMQLGRNLMLLGTHPTITAPPQAMLRTVFVS